MLIGLDIALSYFVRGANEGAEKGRTAPVAGLRTVRLIERPGRR
jgi:hypothetical protein